MSDSRNTRSASRAVSAIGFPLSYQWIFTHGEYQGNSTVTAASAPGNSGGGVFDEDGHYIGLVQTIALYMSPYGALTFGHIVGIVEILSGRHCLGKGLRRCTRETNYAGSPSLP